MRPFRIGLLLFLGFYLLMVMGCSVQGDYRILDHHNCVKETGSYVACLNKEIYQ